MKQVTQTVYRYTELSDDVQKAVRYDFIKSQKGDALFRRMCDGLYLWLFGTDNDLHDMVYVEKDLGKPDGYEFAENINLYGTFSVRALLHGLEKAGQLSDTLYGSNPDEYIVYDNLSYMTDGWADVKDLITAYGSVDKLVDTIKPLFDDEPVFEIARCRVPGNIFYNAHSFEWGNLLKDISLSEGSLDAVTLEVAKRLCKKAYSWLCSSVDKILSSEFLYPEDASEYEETKVFGTLYYKNGGIYIPDETSVA